MNPSVQVAIEQPIDQRVKSILETRPEVERALRSYARDLGVSVDHVILGALIMVAQDYNEATGNGMIPRLSA